ncbi:MAG: hypothetical protein K6D37_12675 [Prevotella sp.]|nr:hypothetical protein [Prevotella sp.]
MKRTEFRVSIQLPLEPFTNVAYGLCESMNDRDFAETNFKVSVIEGVQRGDIVRDEYEISADLPFDIFFILMDCLKEEVGVANLLPDCLDVRCVWREYKEDPAEEEVMVYTQTENRLFEKQPKPTTKKKH